MNICAQFHRASRRRLSDSVLSLITPCKNSISVDFKKLNIWDAYVHIYVHVIVASPRCPRTLMGVVANFVECNSIICIFAFLFSRWIGMNPSGKWIVLDPFLILIGQICLRLGHIWLFFHFSLFLKENDLNTSITEWSRLDRFLIWPFGWIVGQEEWIGLRLS